MSGGKEAIIIGVENKNRWYDNDATVSLAVSILRNAELDKQVLASQKIIEIAKTHDILVKNVSPYFRTFRRRWYDVDDDLYLAMECLKAASLEIQKKIAVEVINYLCEMEN